MKVPGTLEEWREVIENNVEFVDLKGYSHNLISIALGAIAENYGQAEANRAIEEFGLVQLGWNVKRQERATS